MKQLELFHTNKQPISMRKGRAIGFPYIGSKCKQSKQFINFLINEHGTEFTLYDVFAGGCAITFEAMKNNIKVVPNIYDFRIVRMLEYIYSEDYNPIDILTNREAFYELRTKQHEDCTGLELLKLLCNSFCYNFKDYLYNKDISEFKNNLGKIILEKYGVCEYRKTDEYQKIFKELKEQNDTTILTKRNDNGLVDLFLFQIQNIDRIHEIHRIAKKPFEFTTKDYKELKINDKNGIIYLDPPYFHDGCNNQNYVGNVEFNEFIEWCRNQKCSAMYLSSYRNEDFDKIFGTPPFITKHKSTFSGKSNYKEDTKLEVVYRIK